MDLLAHGLYGVTVCSRAGLAGGRRGSPRRWYRESTVWWAFLFGLLPDILSMWVPFAVHVVAGPPGIFFHHFGGGWLVVYRVVHSLVAAAAVSCTVLVLRRRLFVPSLAWSLHVVLDAISHGEGKWQTLLFYPFSSWGIDGIGWWHTPWLFITYWAVLPAAWSTLRVWRKRGRQAEG
ncbi:hypothetical protein ACFLSJ_01865 [Verrucomicrobiota bacterium]